MKDRAKHAEMLFTDGYNCSQSVFCSFTDLTKMDEAIAFKVSQGLGGGVGRMREVCGAVTGAALVIGLLFGTDDPMDKETKADVYKKVREFSQLFKEETGSIICMEHLKISEMEKSYLPEERTENYYKSRPCIKLVSTATEILEGLIAGWQKDG